MIPHNLPTLGTDEETAAIKTLSSGWLAEGPEVKAFEDDLCDFFSIPHGHAVAVSSGSAALYLALWALNGQGKKIGLPVYSCPSLRNSVGLINGIPMYLDCAIDSVNINSSTISASNIDILIAPSMFGIPVRLPKKRGFKIIEDVAQSLGALSSGIPIGLRGDIGICSFYATKLITSGGQGGALISHDKSRIDKIKDFRAFDYRKDNLLRFNFQMSDLQAAIGRAQLKKLPLFIAKREEIFRVYREGGIDLIDESSDDISPVRFRCVMNCEDPIYALEKLNKVNIKAIIPIESEELLHTPSLYPNALHLTRHTVSLPCYPSLSIKTATFIASVARKIK